MKKGMIKMGVGSLLLDGLGVVALHSFAHSYGDMIRDFKKYGYASMATDRGSVTIWKRGDGFLEGDYCVHLITRCHFFKRSQRDLFSWTKRQIKLAIESPIAGKSKSAGKGE